MDNKPSPQDEKFLRESCEGLQVGGNFTLPSGYSFGPPPEGKVWKVTNGQVHASPGYHETVAGMTDEQFLQACEPMSVVLGPNVPRSHVDEIVEGLKQEYESKGGKNLQVKVTAITEQDGEIKPGSHLIEVIPARKEPA